MNTAIKILMLCLLVYAPINWCMYDGTNLFFDDCQEECPRQFAKKIDVAMTFMAVWERYGLLMNMIEQIDSDDGLISEGLILDTVRLQMISRGCKNFVLRSFCIEIEKIIGMLEKIEQKQNKYKATLSTIDSLKKLVVFVRQSSAYGQETAQLYDFVQNIRKPCCASNNEQCRHCSEIFHENDFVVFSGF